MWIPCLIHRTPTGRQADGLHPCIAYMPPGSDEYVKQHAPFAAAPFYTFGEQEAV